ncbi:hypothetical protein [Mucilaginibacter sp. OK283]|jgi:hypothetical protein|uniref:hypothetical protein n=1 Tax=Mucilaginibacter sp. OK283 TaxID=1881049 RepID=UPI0008D286B8|nr:hypothetical protein [Mucilaginibacter sp. OK283]SEP43401.1 hypothetical protein SAMN05428947_11828 [Mucilaginibacter sp. OK283]
MEIIFELTHGIMLVCGIIIIYYSVFYTGENKIELKFALISRLKSKIKSMPINRVLLYRLASHLIFIFFR